MVPSVYNATVLAVTLIVVLYIATQSSISNWLIAAVMIFALAFPESKRNAQRIRKQ